MKRSHTSGSPVPSKVKKREETSKHHSNQSSFPIYPHSKYDYEFPHFAQPSEVGQFSLDQTSFGKGRIYNDARKLKFYLPPKDTRRCNFDLGKGYKQFIKKDEDIKERLDNLLKWILENKELFPLNEDGLIESLKSDFVMWRGHLTKILCTPYIKDSWAMAVSLFHGTYFMSEVETEENEKRRKEMNEREKEMTYWGYKFEQYVTSAKKDENPNTSEPVDNHDAFCSVIRSSLKKHQLLYSGEVDCILAESTKTPPGNYVELKTSREWYTQRNEDNFYRFKLIKWWAQSFLVGIPEVICGFRDDDGIVNRLKTFPTFEMAKQAKRYWSGAVAFNFCEQFLNFVKEVVTVDDAKKVYLFERRPNSSEVTFRVLEDPADIFLPDWFTSNFTTVDTVKAIDQCT